MKENKDELNYNLSMSKLAKNPFLKHESAIGDRNALYSDFSIDTDQLDISKKTVFNMVVDFSFLERCKLFVKEGRKLIECQGKVKGDSLEVSLNENKIIINLRTYPSKLKEFVLVYDNEEFKLNYNVILIYFLNWANENAVIDAKLDEKFII